MKRQLISSREAVDGVVQHTEPCSDCPMARAALPGWLGGSTPWDYTLLAHSNTVVPCHAINGQQCAGMAIYRANVYKRTTPPNLTLPINREKVFATPRQFLNHHKELPCFRENATKKR